MEIPGFILQPLVENSILHGLDQTKPNGKIDIHVGFKEKYLCIGVEDNGVGMAQDKIEELLKPSPAHKERGLNIIGMKIVDRRLREKYWEQYRTEIESSEGLGTRISLWIPQG